MPNLYKPEGILLQSPQNREFISSAAGLERAFTQNKILESSVLLCDESFNLHVDLYGMHGIIPKEEVSYQKDGSPVKDIAVITRVGKPICFKIMSFELDEYGRKYALLSRRQAQIECTRSYLSDLIPGDIIPGKVTHMESFGAFVDIGCGIVSLMSIDSISVSRISHPSDRFEVGEYIPVIVKSIDENGRFFITHRELLGTWEENAAGFSPGQTVAGIVRSVENYGIFVELTPNLAGLAEYREDIYPGQSCAVYIKSIIRERMKIKLVIIDAHGEKSGCIPYKYFVDVENVCHMDKWRYSPECCEKIIESIFD